MADASVVMDCRRCRLPKESPAELARSVCHLACFHYVAGRPAVLMTLWKGTARAATPLVCIVLVLLASLVLAACGEAALLNV